MHVISVITFSMVIKFPSSGEFIATEFKNVVFRWQKSKSRNAPLIFFRLRNLAHHFIIQKKWNSPKCLKNFQKLFVSKFRPKNPDDFLKFLPGAVSWKNLVLSFARVLSNCLLLTQFRERVWTWTFLSPLKISHVNILKYFVNIFRRQIVDINCLREFSERDFIQWKTRQDMKGSQVYFRMWQVYF